MTSTQRTTEMPATPGSADLRRSAFAAEQALCTFRCRRENNRHARPARPQAFSLIELMLAMGLLAVAMSMVAALFPVAVTQSKEANDNTFATLISQNAEAIVKAKLTYPLGLGLIL